MKPLYIIAALVFVLASCSTPQLGFRDDSETPDEHYSVKGRQGLKIKQKLSFGDYSTTNIQRSWTKGSGSAFGSPDVLWVNYERKKQTFRFKLTDRDARESEVFCITQVRSEELVVGRNRNNLFNILNNVSIGRTDNVFMADIYPGKDEPMWQLLIDNNKAQTDSRSYIGYLAKDEDNYYTLVPARHMKIKEKTGPVLFGSIGFEIRNRADQLVAAVSLINQGEVYFGEVNEDEKFLLANACSALLLQEFIE
jgi:hypothetical protein